MTDKIFQEMAQQMRPDRAVREELFARIDAEAEPATGSTTQEPAAPRRWARWLAPAVAAVTVVGLIGAGVSGGWSVNSGGTTVTAETAVADYGTLFAAVRNAPTPAETVWGAGAVDDRRPAPVAAESSSWKTNVQVQNVDEGDLVKSDGRTIFAASGTDVVLIAADGQATHVLSRIDTSAGEAGKPSGTGHIIQGPVVDLMVRGTILIVIVTEYQARTTAIGTDLPQPGAPVSVPFDASLTKVLIYDVADPAAPRYLSSLGQSGGLVTTRLADNLLYLVTKYTVIDPKAAKKDDPTTFAPVFTQDQVITSARPGDCAIMPAPTGPTYAVVSSVDLDKRTRLDSKSVLGGADTVYMSGTNLYLAAADDSPSKAAIERAKAPKGIKHVAVTHLARISINAGQLAVAAQGSVPGLVLDQFALDEWDGRLRVVTTVEGDDAHNQPVRRAGLWVLDADLSSVGSIPSLVKDESVRSVRFDGAIGYVVTFRSVDPLFAIDLSNAQAPRVLSALKIPGFSSYLHPWAQGRLFGFGQDITSAGEERGLKLSMFDTANPRAVTELTTLRVAADYSEALTDHRAVLVDAAAGLVGVPVMSWKQEKLTYRVYRYDPAGGFSQVGRVAVARGTEATEYGVRGLTINGTLYVVSPKAVMAYGLANFAQVADVALYE